MDTINPMDMCTITLMDEEQSPKKPEKTHTCLQCGATFNRPHKLAQHLLLHQSIRIYECEEVNCNKSYSTKSHLDRHTRTVHMKNDFPQIYSCPVCMAVCSNRQNMRRHIKTKHNPALEVVCDICKMRFRKKHQLSAHMYQHTFIKSFSCNLCEEKFITRADKVRHNKYHKTYNCEHCIMTFDHWSQYQKHKKTHIPSEYICDECGRKFKKRDHIVHHIKIHTNYQAPKIYKCYYEDCERVYTRNSNLKQHIQMFHLNIKHECTICLAELSTKARLKSHMLTHTRPEVVFKPKTKLTGRKERKDKGISKISTALRIAGLIGHPIFGDPDQGSSEQKVTLQTNRS